MPQADLLVELFKTASGGDQMSFRQTAEELIKEEKGKGHWILADRLTQAIRPERNQNQDSRQSKLLDLNGSGVKKELFHEVVPERRMSSLILPGNVDKQIMEFVEEQHRSELLHAHCLRARNRILLVGPPGNGKTTLAEALAYELMYPLIVVRYENLIGSYLGETSSRLKELLQYARTQRCVLFFDEFETLGKERGDTHETGEIKRVVSSFLLQLDALPDYVVVVGASNHQELLDRAVWRRFQLRLELPMPTQKQIASLIATIFANANIEFDGKANPLAKKLLGRNFSEIEEFCLSVARRGVLGGASTNIDQIVLEKVNELTSSGSLSSR